MLSMRLSEVWSSCRLAMATTAVTIATKQPRSKAERLLPGHATATQTIKATIALRNAPRHRLIATQNANSKTDRTHRTAKGSNFSKVVFKQYWNFAFQGHCLVSRDRNCRSTAE